MPDATRDDHARRTRRGLVVLFALIAVEAWVAAALLLLRRSEVQTSVLLGYSAPRLAATFFAIAIGVFSGWMAGAVRARRPIQQRLLAWMTPGTTRDAAVMVLLVLAVVAWIAVFLPAEAFGRLGAHLAQLRPASTLALLAVIEALVLLAWEYQARYGMDLYRVLREHRGSIAAWALVCAGIGVLWGFMAVTRLGLNGEGEDYWYGAGVPILAYAALAGLIAAALTTVVEQRAQRLPRRTDLVVFLVIWLVSGLAWMATPATNGWFNPGDFPPTFKTFPFSDAAKYDLPAQSALMGEGLTGGAARARPLYPAFLVLVHFLTGQDYEANMRFQAAVLGVFPALMYLLGARLLNRSSGLAAACMAALRGVHAISATDVLDLANAKLMLPDFPAALGIAAVLIFCATWLRSPRRMEFALLAGGALAFSTYLRPTALGIGPALLLAAWIASRRVPRRIVAVGLGLLVAGYVMAALPWETQGPAGRPGGPSTFNKILGALRSRFPAYSGGVPTPGTEDNLATGGPEITSVPTRRASSNQDEGPRSGSDGTPPTPIELQPLPIARHFLHNVAASALILPTSPALDDLHATIHAAPYTSWKWAGTLTGGQVLVFAAALAIAAAGFIAATRRNRGVGLMPAAAFFAYLLANSFGRTSGGRYIVPVDWILLLYFALGLALTMRWSLRAIGLGLGQGETGQPSMPEIASGRRPQRALISAAIGVVLAGSLLLLPDHLFTAAEPRSEQELASEVSSYLATLSTGVNDAYVQDLMLHGGSAYSGRILYPRSAAGDANGEYFFGTASSRIPFPILGFSLIGPADEREFRLALPQSDKVRHYEEAIVIGCRQWQRVDAVLILLKRPSPEVRFRQPLPPPTCPLVEPVCDQNRNCR